MKNDIFNKISPSEALEILKQIAKTDKKLKKKIVELAEELFRDASRNQALLYGDFKRNISIRRRLRIRIQRLGY